MGVRALVTDGCAIPLTLAHKPASLGRETQEKPRWVVWTPAGDGAVAAESGPSHEGPEIALDRETPSQPP